MARDYSFKKVTNLPRQTQPEETFNLGMNYTDSPIDPGQSNILYNFDIANDGKSLKPRSGIRVSSIAAPINSYPTNIARDFSNCNLSTINEITYNSIKYKYAVLFDTALEDIILGTITSKETDPQVPGIYTEGITLSKPNLKVKYNNFENSSIHGMRIINNKLAYKQIGTKAWNNSYFFFATDSEDATNLYNVKFNEETKIFETNKVTPTNLTALEASPNKYNMLLDNPYTFENSYIAGAFVLQGVLPYLNDELVVSPRLNTKYLYKLAYTAPEDAKYDIIWEWKDFNGTEWTQLKKETMTLSTTTPPEISCEFAAPIKDSLLRISVYGYTTGTVNNYPDQVVSVSINCDPETQKSASNSLLKNYDLSQCKGMCYWQNRLVLWGFNDPILFVSDTNLPEWFPYPNSIDLFEENIIHCEPYLNTLLVFTEQKLFQLTMLPDGSGWSKSCIQDHLQITEYDSNFIKTIKNMVFFKSGNSFYMVVPTANMGSGLTIAPVTKPIQWLFDNFKKSIKHLLTNIYNYRDDIELAYCFNYINNTDIVINYIFKDINGFCINICFIYDTSARTWRIHGFESETIFTMFKLDATTDGTLTTLTPIKQRFSSSANTAREDNSFIIQFFTKDYNNPKDFYIPTNFNFYPEINDLPDESGDPQSLFNTTHKYLNYQYLNTGNRDLGYADMKKRFREFELRINNKSQETLLFGTSFYIDGEDRKNMYRYVVTHDTDISSEDYGLMSVVPELDLSLEIPCTTILSETINNINAWTLENSAFPGNTLYKIRVAVSGKGYHNKLELLSVNEKNYELLGLCWVFKYKNLR